MSACGQVDVVGLGGGDRLVRGCPRKATDEADGQPMCRMHADAARYRKREFRRMMDDATCHTKQFGIGIPGSPGSGVRCSCGEFVPDGAEHPFNVPERILKARREAP